MVDPPAAAGERAISFGPFRLLPKQRLLLEGDKQVRLGSRALDILITLSERPGEVVGKDELMARVWPGTFVEEGNLKFQISALRRTLGGGNRYLVNVPGRGYCFAAPVARSEGTPRAAPQPSATGTTHNLPAQLTRLVGRADAVSRIVAQLPRQRLLTIVGAGGIGKTSVALAAAEASINNYEHGVWLIDLAPLADPRLVPSALTAALGLEIRSDDPLPGLLAFLRDKRMLLVLDNCEHVIEAAATLATSILKGTSGVHILATSREALRVEGERVRRLPPLESPPKSARLTAAEALGFPAVQLFVERAVANFDEFALSDADSPIVADICRQLDGIPLAIEFAAARVEAFGIHGLAAHLDERLRLLTRGRRTALPRHRTLSAMLDSSYQLLAAAEQRVLRRVAIFVGGFTLAAAGAVAADATQPQSEIIDQLAELVAKSLVAADVSGAEPRLRLFETTRAYALVKLADSGEREAVARRHAEYYHDLLETAGQGQSVTADWPAAFAVEIDNIRAAMTWVFSPEGDASLGLALAAASAPVWLRMSLLTECRGWMARAVAGLAAGGRGTRPEMLVQAALASTLMFTQGMNEEAYATVIKALELAESLQDGESQLHSLLLLWGHQIRLAEYRDALALAHRCEAAARQVSDPGATAMADWMLGVAEHHFGDHAAARTHLQRALDKDTPAARRATLAHFGYDRRVHAFGVLGNVLWVLGFPDQAVQASGMSLEEARAVDQALPLCVALAWSGFVMYLAGSDLAVTEQRAAELSDRAAKHSLDSYHAFGLCLSGLCRVRQGDSATGLQLVASGIDGLGKSRYEVFVSMFLGEMAHAAATAGRADDGIAALDQALARVERNAENWCLPELLRLKGELLLMQSEQNRASAAEHFSRSLDCGRRQQALSWELRTVISIARLQRDQGRKREARDLLAPLYGRFTEGFGTADLQIAKRLLDELG